MIEEIEIKFNGKNLFYRYERANGSSKNLILLHGFAFTSKEWENIGIIQKMSRLGFNIYAVDYPGFGSSESNDNFSIQRGNALNGASFILAFMDFMGIGRASVIGASMGGGIAILGATDSEMRIDRMIVIGPGWYPKDSLKLIHIPTLFIYGDRDELLRDEDLIPSLSENNNFSINIMENSGHAAYLDNPEIFLRVCEEFLKN